MAVGEVVEKQVDTVWKIALSAVDFQKVTIPKGAKFLCVREQHGQIVLWFRCNPNTPLESRRIVVAGTGHGVPDDNTSIYLGTAFLYDGELVFHVFELIGNEDGEEVPGSLQA